MGAFASSILHHCKLETKADSQEWNVMRTHVFYCSNLSLRTSYPESSGHKNPVEPGENTHLFRLLLKIVGFDPFKIDPGIRGGSSILQSLIHTDVAVCQLRVFAANRNVHLFLGVEMLVNHLL